MTGIFQGNSRLAAQVQLLSEGSADPTKFPDGVSLTKAACLGAINELKSDVGPPAGAGGELR